MANGNINLKIDCLEFMANLEIDKIKQDAIKQGYDFRSSILGIVDIYQLQNDGVYEFIDSVTADEFIDSVKAENEPKALWLAKERVM